MTINVDLGERSYDITLERGCIARAAELLDIDRKCLIVTDDGVPAAYAEAVAAQCREACVVTVPQGEASKSLARLEELLSAMLDEGFTRSDCVVAVGGGMPGDLAGFAAATYMRGIDFYNIPTTILSQADSSIGGKTAVNLGGAKNSVGAFHQPKAVLIDADTLASLPEREAAAGMAEIVKSGLIADAKLFEMFEERCGAGHARESAADGAAGMDGAADDAAGMDGAADGAAGKGEATDVSALIEAAIRVKKAVVEEDEREAGLRRILNFGHTIGHGIESVTGMLHGECVALGMIPMCSEPVRERLVKVLESLGLPTRVDCSADDVYEAMLHDKKMKDGRIAAVIVDEPGKATIGMMTPAEMRVRIEMIADAG